MPSGYIFDPANAALVFASEFLARHQGRGSSLTLRHLGMRFHGVTDCLYLGAGSQALLPLMPSGDTATLPFILRDSCPYTVNEPQLSEVASTALADSPIDELAEAAPFVPRGAYNLWHWMTESLPKILALEEIGYTGSYIVPEDSQVARQSLELVGIAPARLKSGRKSWLVRRMLVPPRFSGFSLADNMPLTALLRAKLLSALPAALSDAPSGPKRLYLRRVGIRKLANEDEILPILQEFGFIAFTPEDMTLREQMTLMRNAECAVMSHGAGSFFSLLLKEGATFIEFYGNRYLSYTNLHAVRYLKLRYHPITEELDPSVISPGNPITARQYLETGPKADISPDPLHLRIILETSLGSGVRSRAF